MSKKKIIDSAEIDFLSGECKISDDLKAECAIEKVSKCIQNPYIGNKKKILNFLYSSMKELDIKYDSFLDLFSGSAFVSSFIKLLDKKVITNDLLTCSYLNSVAFVKNRDVALSKEDINKIFIRNNKPFIDNKYLSRISEREKEIIESFYNNFIELWGNPLDEDSNIKSSIACVCMQNYIMQKCFVGGRLNNGQILAKYDYRLKHLRNKGVEMFSNGKTFSYEKGIEWISPIYKDDKNSHECYNLDSIEFLEKIKPDVDLCYIDPPYGGEQSNYGNMYSFFEELIYRKPYDEIKSERLGYDRFISHKNYKENFERLISLCSYIPVIIISYNDSSWGSVEEICDVIKAHRKDILVKEIVYKYKQRERSGPSKEYLFFVR